MSANFFARDAWFGFDKIEHYVWSIAYWLVCCAITGNGWGRLGLFAAGAIGVELVQFVRFYRWVQRGRPQPRPAFCDAFSFRDLVWDAAGMFTAIGALARIAARAAAVVVVLVAGAGAAVAQAPELRKEPTFQMQHVAVDSMLYGQDILIYLSPLHGYLMLMPAGDSIVIINAVAFGPTMAPATGPACASALRRPAVLTSRLVLGRPDSVWWHQDFIQRGQTRLFTHWEQPLPSGDTLRLMEVWRRGSDCAAHDGTLVVLFTIRRGARR